jgi:hypothetical protein
MSLEQVRVFYEVLASERELYEEYFNQCGRQGFFGSWHWNKTKIVSFGAALGYTFTENELEQLWFDSDTSNCDSSVTSLEYESISQGSYERVRVKKRAKVGVS